MSQQPAPYVQNNFIGGLKTEFTGLNFPENACTDTLNCTFDVIGDVTRRGGIDFEPNSSFLVTGRNQNAISGYKWNNVGGDGNTQLIVEQVGASLYFYKSSAATVSSPLSAQILASIVTISGFVASGATFDASVECQFTDGNGYLFVFHPNCDPFYCTYSSGVVTGNIITVQVRDFVGYQDLGLTDSTRPGTLSPEHQYNLINQGWTAGGAWTLTSGTDVNINNSSKTFTCTPTGTGISIPNGTSIQIVFYGGSGTSAIMSGTSTGYVDATGVLTVNVTSTANSLVGPGGPITHFNNWTITPLNIGYMNTWFTAIGNYPSNSDVWWNFKNSSGVFAPVTTINNVSLGSGPAPKGHFILNPFNQNSSAISGVAGLTSISTTVRPRTGAWYQGRVWYSGVDAASQASGDASYTTWTENVYFSQIVQSTTGLGKCYQANDPTSETLFDLLPTDGGVITIQGSGSIYKLFPIQTGMFVFAANGVWYIAGSSGVGFSANDYTVIKVSGVQSISGSSFVNVLGWPVFWNEEGIYEVLPASQMDTQNNRHSFFDVNNIALGNILTYYANIPLQSKKFVKGDYSTVDYNIQWIFKSTNETDVNSRYSFNMIMNYNTHTKAFYPWSVGTTATAFVNDIRYVAGPGGSTSPMPNIKYFSSAVNTTGYYFAFADEHDTTHYVDWFTINSVGVNYSSYFISGYNIKGQALHRWQPEYVYMYSGNNPNTQYQIQGIWDFATSGNTGRFSNFQKITNSTTNFSNRFRRHRVRGRGLVFQLSVKSVDGQPFHFIGWAIDAMINSGT